MPKSLVLGNGNILIGFDKFGQVKDFYFPYVGQENQTGGRYVHKIGVWVNNQFSWLDDGSWNIDINYKYQTLASQIQAVNNNLKVKLNFDDIVYNESNIFIRQVIVQNLDDKRSSIRVFFNQQFQLYESMRGDTAYFDPIRKCIVHYKGRRVFLINAMCGSRGIDDYCVGLFNIEGKEGTFKDAEDGELAKNPIEHGLVDSVIKMQFDLDPKESWIMHYWITAAEFIKDAISLNDYVLKKSPQYLMKTTQDFWTAWVNKQDFHFVGLTKDIVELFKKSLLIVRTHVDNGGAIIASCDSDMLEHGRDTYGYMWPRDGALVAQALDKAGDDNVAKRFFEFCNKVISDEGYFMHKYRADTSLGSSWHPWSRFGKLEYPIQEDETALVISALWQHYQLTKDIEFIEGIYNSLIKKAAEFMISFRDSKTGLPKPSYDIWEEKFGIHTFTAASVYGALIVAANFAHLLGKTESEQKYKGVAEEIKNAILEHLYDPQEGYFYKGIFLDNEQINIDKTVDMSSVYGIFRFGILDIDDPRLAKAIEKTVNVLTVQTDVGGIVRFEGDMYYRTGDTVPGNPWFITTLWLAQYYIKRAKNEPDLEIVKKWLSWAVKYASASGIMSEQINPYTGEGVSAAPLTWSHSEFITTVVEYLDKLEELGLCQMCNPVK